MPAAPNPFGCRNSRRDTRTPSDRPGSVGHGCLGGYGGYGGCGGAGIGYRDGFHAAGLMNDGAFGVGAHPVGLRWWFDASPGAEPIARAMRPPWGHLFDAYPVAPARRRR